MKIDGMKYSEAIDLVMDNIKQGQIQNRIQTQKIQFQDMVYSGYENFDYVGITEMEIKYYWNEEEEGM